MIRRYLVVIVATLALLLPMASPAGAIRDGVPDNGAHPYVGLVVFYDADGVPLHRCSGTLIAPTVFLTAGHCTTETASAQVWFDEAVTTALGYPFTGGITGTPITYPGFSFVLPDTGDVGLVILDEEVTNLGYGAVADVGTLDALATRRGRQNTSFDVVGYGLQEVKPRLMQDRVRLQATVQLVNLRSALTDGFNIHYTNAQGTGGGTCFGDSGGPVFLNGTNIVVAVNSFVLNENCAGAGFAYRVDTEGAHGFIFGE
jgi:secreted trypsin-like serine protease